MLGRGRDGLLPYAPVLSLMLLSPQTSSPGPAGARLGSLLPAHRESRVQDLDGAFLCW